MEEFTGYATTNNLTNHIPKLWVFYPSSIGVRKISVQFSGREQIIFHNYEGWNYLTCYKETELSLKFYTDPFQWQVWICIAITVTIFSILTDLFVAKKLKKEKVLSSSFFYFGAFLEESSSLCSELLKHPAFRVGVGPWILLSSILSNVYVSLILRGLNSPPPPTHFDTWASLLPPNSSRNESKDLEVLHRIVSVFPDPNSTYFERFSILSTMGYMPKVIPFDQAQYAWYSTLLRFFFKIEKNFTNLDKFLLSLVNPKFRWFPKSLMETWKSGAKGYTTHLKSAIEEELVECGKSVFVASESEIRRYHLHLRKEYPFIFTYIGRNPILREFEALRFHCPKDSKVLKYFKYFFETGTYNYYSELYIRNKTWHEKSRISKQIKEKKFKDKSWERVKALGLESSVNTLFLILVAILGFGGCVFVGENLKSKDRRRVARVWVELLRAKVLFVLTTLSWVLFQC